MLRMAVVALGLLMSSSAFAQTPDGASQTPQGDKPTPQGTSKDKAEKESVKKAPDQTALPKEGAKAPIPSMQTQEATPPK